MKPTKSMLVVTLATSLCLTGCMEDGGGGLLSSLMGGAAGNIVGGGNLGGLGALGGIPGVPGGLGNLEPGEAVAVGLLTGADKMIRDERARAKQAEQEARVRKAEQEAIARVKAAQTNATSQKQPVAASASSRSCAGVHGEFARSDGSILTQLSFDTDGSGHMWQRIRQRQGGDRTVDVDFRWHGIEPSVAIAYDKEVTERQPSGKLIKRPPKAPVVSMKCQYSSDAKTLTLDNEAYVRL